MNKFLLVGFILFIDWYAFRSFRFLIHKYSWHTNIKNIIYILYCSLTVLNWGFIIFFLFIRKNLHHPTYSNESFLVILFSVAFFFFLSKIIGSIFILLDDIKVFLLFIIKKGIILFSSTNYKTKIQDITISRSAFLQWISIATSSLLFSSLLLGMRNKYRYTIHTKKIHFPNLPKAFHKLRIVQISDIHSGSLKNIQQVSHGIKMINKLKPDIIFFTGDLVNNHNTEVLPLLSTLSKLYAPLGIYSILGNHDYGDYVKWKSKKEKQENLNLLKEHHKKMGWTLLLNDSVILQKDKQKLGILGVENWSNFSNFSKYGDLEKTHNNCPKCQFKILLSHDPSHWRAEVLKKYSDIHLTLSGHTHGMQFGVEIPQWKWSPIKYLYKEWAGLYKKKHQYLYVNRGFGFIGYAGRVGILPEITLIELHKKT